MSEMLPPLREPGLDPEAFDDYRYSKLADMLEHQMVAKELKELAATAIVTDEKTGLLTAASFERLVAEHLGHHNRHGDMAETNHVLLVDGDRFGSVNNTYGHLTGDNVIKATANSIKQATRQNSDLAARWGGEEYAVFLSHTDLPGALTVARNIQDGLRPYTMTELLHETRDPDDFNQDELDRRPTVSIGIAELPYDGDYTTAFARADEAMYMAKQAGRDRIVALLAGNMAISFVTGPESIGPEQQ